MLERFHKIYDLFAYNRFRVIEMAKKIKCTRCGEIFKKPTWGLKPIEYKAGIKMPGGLVALGAIITCPKCGFEGSLKEFELVDGE